MERRCAGTRLGEHIEFRLIHEGGKLPQIGPQLIGNLTPLRARLLGVVLGKAVAMKRATTGDRSCRRRPWRCARSGRGGAASWHAAIC